MFHSIRLVKSPHPSLFSTAALPRRRLPITSRLAINPLDHPNPRRLVAALAPCRRLSLPSMEPAGDPSPKDYVHVSGPDPPHSTGAGAGAGESDLNPSPIADPEPPEASARMSAEDPPTRAPAAAETSIEGEGGSKGVLPDELTNGVVFLECESSAGGGTCDVYLVGTAHVSQESCRQVREVIRCLKPQVVFLELCPSRIAILTPQNLKVPTVNEMIDMWKTKKMNIFGILYSWFLAKVADKLEVFPGSEFRVAFEEAMSYGAKVILGDRPVHITLRRTWGKMSLWHRTKFLYYILFQTIFLPSTEDLNKMLEEMDDVDMLTLLIQEMSKAFPTLMETLLYERDLYMSSTLLTVASEHSSVVAVVGKGHLSGIKQHWKQPIEVQHLMEIPSNSADKSRMKILASVGVAVTAVAIASGFYLLGKR